MEFDFQTWLKLVRYHVAFNTNKSLRSDWVEKFTESTDWKILDQRHTDGFSPEQMANEIVLFVEKYQKDKEEKNKQRKLAEQERRKKSIERITKRVENARSNEEGKRSKSEINEILGTFVGDEIINRYLYTLSVDYLQSYKMVEVSQEDYNKHHDLHQAWLDAEENSVDRNQKWEVYQSFYKHLQKKYLPEKIECYFYNLDCITDMEKFRYGISSILWDCDMSHYDVSNFLVEQDGRFHTKITLFLGED